VIDASRAVTNLEVPMQEGPRRAGDCTKLVSGSSRTKKGTRLAVTTLVTGRDDWRCLALAPAWPLRKMTPPKRLLDLRRLVRRADGA